MEDKQQKITVPKSFVGWLDGLAKKVSETTGFHKSRIMTLKEIAKKIKHKIIMRWLFR